MKLDSAFSIRARCCSMAQRRRGIDLSIGLAASPWRAALSGDNGAVEGRARRGWLRATLAAKSEREAIARIVMVQVSRES